VEFLHPLFKAGPAKRLQRRLSKAADALGVLNDLYVAEDLLRPHAEAEPAAWFAVGWVVARREAALFAAAQQLRRLAEADRPWRRR
jgi:triphosphatase